jgi:hypothetical protein
MNTDQIKQFIRGGTWESIAIELRPGIAKAETGEIQPTYMFRTFRFSENDRFECTATTYADPAGKVPLAKFVIHGHNVWQGDHPVAAGAQNVDFVADISYQVIPLHAGFADLLNKISAQGFSPWAVDEMQEIKGRAFPFLGIAEGTIYVDYDLIYVFNDLIFMGSKHVDGRAFDKPENRPTNLQIPIVRR